jgi:hexosaminidase
MNYKSILGIALILISFNACKKDHAPSDLAKVSVIPKPVSVTPTGGIFTLSKEASISVDNDELTKVGEYLSGKWKSATGFDLKVSSVKSAPSSGIFLSASKNDAQLGDEGYELTITSDLIKIEANKSAGVFRGIQTLRQLLPATAELATLQTGSWEIATGTIRDYPAYAYRGSMLDLGRHFFGVDDVKRYIDLIALYKMNIMHLGLTNDQGWRIEIKTWPNLTTYGGSTEVGGGKGGFFTQEQYKDIVQYAADRFITIVPEIDSPGHSNAALASYAELNCDGKATKLYTGTNVGFSTLCAKKEVTYKFMDDVIRELAEITPGPWIHIGGDESHATKKDDYILFVTKMQDIVQSHGKQMIGWDEISQAELKPNTVAQYWSNDKNAAAAAAKGAKIIMSPAKKTYLDMKYDTSTKLGQHWAAYIEVDSAYLWNPSTYAKGVSRDNILGIESPLWTETIVTMDDIEYMVFPRLLGQAEVGWTPDNLRSWDDYKVRLGEQAARLKALDINFYNSAKVPWKEGESGRGAVPPGSK